VLYEAIKGRAGDQDAPAHPDRYDRPVINRFAQCLVIDASFFSGFFDRIRPRSNPFRFLAH